MKKCKKCSKADSTDKGLCYAHLAEVAEKKDGFDRKEFIEWLTQCQGPDYEWFAGWFDKTFGYKGADREKVYAKAYEDLQEIVVTAYEAGLVDGAEDGEDAPDEGEDENENEDEDEDEDEEEKDKDKE